MRNAYKHSVGKPCRSSRREYNMKKFFEGRRHACGVDSSGLGQGVVTRCGEDGKALLVSLTSA